MSWKTGLPALRAGRVSLREMQPEDEVAIVRLFRNPKVHRHLADPPRTRAAFRQYLQWSSKNRLAGRYTGFAVRQGTRTVGMMFVWVTAPGTAEIGFAMDPSVWGTGAFQAAARLMCRFAFRRMKLHRLEMRIAMGNRRAQVAAQKLGGVPEALLRESFAKNGRHLDSVLYRLLPGELAH